MKTLQARMAAVGFSIFDTGGGCFAYGRENGQVRELVTAAYREDIPQLLRTKVVVGEYKIQGDEVSEGEYLYGFKFEDVLSALEHLAPEPYLLSLRLQSGY